MTFLVVSSMEPFTATVPPAVILHTLPLASIIAAALPACSIALFEDGIEFDVLLKLASRESDGRRDISRLCDREQDIFSESIKSRVAKCYIYVDIVTIYSTLEAGVLCRRS